MIKKIIPEKLKNDKKAFVILSIGLLGMIFLLLSCFTGERDAADKGGAADFTALEKSTERRLEELLSTVKDVGSVKVTVTYECTEEYKYAEDEKNQGENKTEREFVITDNGNTDSGLKLLVTAPKVRGVAVSCEGASSDKTKEEVTRLICAVLGIASNRVYVSQMKE